jgi:hypothetical protein
LVEAEVIRPRAGIESLGLVKGARLDLAVPELGIDGLAEVTAVRACPPIAEGEGRVVTGRFVTRELDHVARWIEAANADNRWHGRLVPGQQQLRPDDRFVRRRLARLERHEPQSRRLGKLLQRSR